MPVKLNQRRERRWAGRPSLARRGGLVLEDDAAEGAGLLCVSGGAAPDSAAFRSCCNVVCRQHGAAGEVCHAVSGWVWYDTRVGGSEGHGCDAEAVYCTLGHISGMLKDYGYPVAPECWDPGYKPWGDMYYNWDGAMTALLIERLAGVRYAIPEGSFTVSDHLPDAWRYVETYTPVVTGDKTVWTRTRIDRAVRDGRLTKRIAVEGCPLRTLIVRPWLEDRELVSSDPATDGPASKGHAAFRFTGAGDRSVSLVLGKRNRTFNTLAYLAPHSGEFEDSVTVGVRNLMEAATLRYTTDGSPPTRSSPLCKGPLTFTKTTTLTLRAFSDDGTVFTPMTATYTKSKAE